MNQTNRNWVGTTPPFTHSGDEVEKTTQGKKLEETSSTVHLYGLSSLGKVEWCLIWQYPAYVNTFGDLIM